MKRILFTCSREPSYTRNEVILEELRTIDNARIDVVVSRFSSYLARLTHLYALLAVKRLTSSYDLVFVGFLAQPLIPLVKLLFPRTRIVADGFISLHDTLVLDRKTIKRGSALDKTVFRLERFIFSLPSLILFDTQAHADHISEKFGVPKGKIDFIYVLANTKIFHPNYKIKRPEALKGQTEVFYYATYLPLHGVDKVIEAAEKVQEKSPNIHFTIVGRGSQYEYCRRLEKRLRVKNITFMDWVPYKKLPEFIVRSDICLGGHFADNPKGCLVIPGKTFQLIACAKPVIVSDNAANHEVFVHKKNAYFCKPNNAGDLAKAIMELADDQELRSRIAKGGYLTFTELQKKSSNKFKRLIRTQLTQ